MYRPQEHSAEQHERRNTQEQRQAGEARPLRTDGEESKDETDDETVGESQDFEQDCADPRIRSDPPSHDPGDGDEPDHHTGDPDDPDETRMLRRPRRRTEHVVRVTHP